MYSVTRGRLCMTRSLIPSDLQNFQFRPSAKMTRNKKSRKSLFRETQGGDKRGEKPNGGPQEEGRQKLGPGLITGASDGYRDGVSLETGFADQVAH
jgi:hypothetical protein